MQVLVFCIADCFPSHEILKSISDSTFRNYPSHMSENAPFNKLLEEIK